MGLMMVARPSNTQFIKSLNDVSHDLNQIHQAEQDSVSSPLLNHLFQHLEASLSSLEQKSFHLSVPKNQEAIQQAINAISIFQQNHRNIQGQRDVQAVVASFSHLIKKLDELDKKLKRSLERKKITLKWKPEQANESQQT